MDLYQTAVRPLIFKLYPETAHALSKPILKSAVVCRLLGGGVLSDPRLEVQIGSLRVPNPVALAPGFDKGGELTTGMSQLGFGYLVVGSVMPEARPGNAAPRIVHLAEQQSIVNCMGLPGHGVDIFAAALQRGKSAVPVVASFGATRAEDFRRSFALLQPLADALEINQRCANNPDDVGGLQEAAAFAPILKSLVAAKTKPLRVKLDAYINDSQRDQRMTMLELLVANGIDGVGLPTNYLTPNDQLSRGIGNISGAVLFERSLDYVRRVYDATGGRIAIHARGGIGSGAQAFAAIAAGASTVELYTAMIYQGWSVARRINLDLLAIMRREGVASVRELRGAHARSRSAQASSGIAEASEADHERLLSEVD